jgi:hypothetical protein
LFAAGLLSVPPADIPLYIGLACIAIIQLIFGSRGYQIFGVIALIFSLVAILGEHEAGIRIKKEKMMNELRQRIATNTPAAQPVN